ncbi:MAG: Tex family protein [Wenzhouxiangellaceae bacterium]
MPQINHAIATELAVKPHQVHAAIKLLDDGATVPFVARYRKEATGGLDDTQLRQLEERLRYLRDLEDRRQTVLKSIAEQGKLSDELKTAINEADSKSRLEDLYRPYRPKRRTKGQIAREAGLEPLADALLNDPNLDPLESARDYINEAHDVADADAALVGARSILLERFSEDAELVGQLRRHMETESWLCVRAIYGKDDPDSKFRDYFDYRERWHQVPSHRALAILRGRSEGVLLPSVALDPASEDQGPDYGERAVARHWNLRARGRPADEWLLDCARGAWKEKLHPHLETALMVALRERAESGAIQVFADNLKDLLLAAPAGPKVIIGLDPGLRTGVKVAVVDATSRLLGHTVIYPHPPQKQYREAMAVLLKLCREHQVQLVSIGNGTASRETDRMVADLLKQAPELRLTKIVVSEAGASVYSASELAAREFPDLDVSYRGAVSIARRLQDPLAELVKIDPKSIGVGQYQHDVNQTALARKLEAVVEDCVNAVGVDVNTASAALLSRVAGLSPRLADNIVAHREAHGRFERRSQLLKVAGLGPKTYEQCAGFLRIMDGADVLDRSAVHPESYEVVQRIARDHQRTIVQLIGDSAFLRGLKAGDYTDERFGLPTVNDILRELEKPGRDPRPEFRTASFQDGVETMADLTDGMVLEGVVSNVTNFGAFVDIGVHQDGLVHISAMARHFVKDPRSVVKAGDIVKVKVMSVDLKRKRIALSMRLDDEPTA